MCYLGLFVHSGFGDWSVGSAMEVTDQEILIFTIEDHLAQLYSLSGHHIYTIRSHLQHLQDNCHLSSTTYIPSVHIDYMKIYVNLCNIYVINI